MARNGTQFSEDDMKSALRELFEEQPFITTSDLAEKLTSSRETARNRLNKHVERGELEARKVGGRAKVWYMPPIFDPETEIEEFEALSNASASAENTRSTVEKSAKTGGRMVEHTSYENHDGDSSTEEVIQQEPETVVTSLPERVLFFPSRREVVVSNPTEETRGVLSQTAHLVDSNGDGYMYKVDDVDVWNAPYDTFEAFRESLQSVIGDEQWAGGFESRIHDDWDRAHQFRLRTHEDGYTILEAEDSDTFENVAKRKLNYNTHYTEFLSDDELRVTEGGDARVKEALYDEGYPVVDERRLENGTDIAIELSDAIELRDYQQQWVESFVERQAGVFAGPSGSGKTVAAIGAMAALSGETLIIVPNRELCQQWTSEILDKTTVSRREIGQYHGEKKQIRPITIATYSTASMSRHRKLFNEREWKLVVADECHHAVANTWKRFREIQSTARLGLSATPVREAEATKEIYTLIGPPIGSDWGRLFTHEWVSKPSVNIITVPWDSEQARERYRRADGSSKLIEAARNPKKTDVVQWLLDEHAEQKVLIFVDWIRQGHELAEKLDLPFIYGETGHESREQYYDQFRKSDSDALIVSRVGDEGIDLPDAEIAILASTMGSSRSQTGQRAGRTMRPIGDSQVYVLLTEGSGEEDWGRESTQYLAEKGANISKNSWNATMEN